MLLILAAAIVTKLIGCGVGAASLGWRSALKIGVGMVPRGEVGVVVAQMGTEHERHRPASHAVVVFMAVVTQQSSAAGC